MTSVTVCIATMRRASIDAALRSLDAQTALDGVAVDIVVADNDETPSARPRIEAVAKTMRTPVAYVHAPARNISLARNATLDAAKGEWMAFLDDDEVAAPDWLAKLLAAARKDGLDIVVGPAVAQYPAGAPKWMEQDDYHSNRPVYRSGRVETGHTCNALVRRMDPRVAPERFLLSKGRSGGEDTEYFFRLSKMGLKLGAADDALVYEPVDPGRLNFRWIAKRKFRAGQSHGYHAGGRGLLQGIRIQGGALAKVVACLLMALLTSWSERRRNFWILRMIMHLGVASTAFGLREQELY